MSSGESFDVERQISEMEERLDAPVQPLVTTEDVGHGSFRRPIPDGLLTPMGRVCKGHIAFTGVDGSDEQIDPFLAALRRWESEA